MAKTADTVRILNQPQPIAVDAGDGGRPEAVSGHGRMRRVVELRDSWRVDDEWWREKPLSRRYFEVLLEGGRVATIYRDLVTGEWFTQPYAPLPRD